MDSKAKSLDLLVIESPFEYANASKKELMCLYNLGDFCRSHGIPVRAHEFLTGERGPIFLESISDSEVLPFFQGCDYKNGLVPDDLRSLNNESSIILTGGMLDYDPINIDAKVSYSKINPAQVLNYAPNEDRKFAFVRGCVPRFADVLSNRLYKESKIKPQIIIEVNSAVKAGAEFNNSKIHRFHLGDLIHTRLEPYWVVEVLGE